MKGHIMAGEITYGQIGGVETVIDLDLSRSTESQLTSDKLSGLVNRYFDRLATAMEVWQELVYEEANYREEAANWWHKRSERLLAAAKRRAQAEGVNVWDATY